MNEQRPVIYNAKGAVMQPVRAQASAFLPGSSGRSEALATWGAPLRSPDASILPNRDETVARIRDLAEQNGYLSGAVQRAVDEAIGARFRLNWRPDLRALGLSDEWGKANIRKVERDFQNYCDDPRRPLDAAGRRDLSGLLGLGFRQRMTDGESLGVVHWLPRQGIPYRTAVQMVSPDRLSTPAGECESVILRGGVQRDSRGKPIGYYIQNGHPTDYWADAATYDWTYVPARTSFGRLRVLHYFEDEGADQSRGRGFLAPALEKLKLGDVYERTELEAALINAVFAAFIETPLDKTFLDELAEEQAELSGYTATRIEYAKMNPIMMNGAKVARLFPGETFQHSGAGRQNAAFPNFMGNVLRHAAAALGQSYEQFANDWSSTNYSSGRMALLQSWKFLIARRTSYAAGFGTPIFGLWLEEYLAQGRLELPSSVLTFWEAPAAWLRCTWIGPGRGWVDPVKEAQAANMRMESGLSTLQKEAAEQGDDWEEILDQRQRELMELSERGLTMETVTVQSPVEIDNPDERPNDRAAAQPQTVGMRLQNLKLGGTCGNLVVD